MNKKTKQLFIFSLSLAILALGFMVFLSYEINVRGVRLEEQLKILSENNSKESSFIKLNRLAQETEKERALLASSFFKDESESIVFLGEVEAVAASAGLALKIDTLDKVTDTEKKQESIKMSFTYTGKKETVVDFSKLLEKAPYHSTVEELSLRKLPDGNWEGKLTILISIDSL